MKKIIAAIRMELYAISATTAKICKNTIEKINIAIVLIGLFLSSIAIWLMPTSSSNTVSTLDARGWITISIIVMVFVDLLLHMIAVRELRKDIEYRSKAATEGHERPA